MSVSVLQEELILNLTKPKNMHPEQPLVVIPESLTSPEQLAHFSLAATLIYLHPEARQIYNDFMWNYHGHPVKSELPDLKASHTEYGEINYSRREVHSYSQFGSLVLVRQADRVYPDQTLNYKVVTANVSDEEITAWRILEVEHQGRGAGLRTSLFLTDKPLDNLQPLPTPTGDIFEDYMQQRTRVLKLQQARARQPQVIMSSQGNRFINRQGDTELLSPITELVSMLKVLEQQFGAVVTANAEDTQQATLVA